MTELLFQPGERTGVLLHGHTLRACAAAHGVTVDFAQLRGALARQTKIAGLFYYPSASEDEGSPECVHAAVAGFRVAAPPAEFGQGLGTFEWVKRQLVETAADMFALAQHADHVVLCSGEGALTPLVRQVQRCGLRVTLVSTVRTRPRLISDELRRQADQFVEFADLFEMLSMPQASQT